ncbi:hypothetical protein DL764_010267 [Monosporascus ibericus]|uniref:Signal peptide peptidase n=1 Tax=Monosporascus ibericus TaxID=155417 RepID=A0A4Q4SUR1_9PEZI|nr:hypothetical protein DL764_010267 [Monosporascus ibericus]
MATNDSTYLNTTEVVTTNLTDVMSTNQTFFEKLASLPTKLYDHQGLLYLEARIVFASLACIYIGSHAALRRPPSARPKRDKGKAKGKQKDEEDDQFVQGLMPSDAILFPIMAGVVLVGLYYLITWLDDPDIINKILRAYFSFTSLAAMGKLFADCLHLLTGFVFPTVWSARDRRLYHIDPVKRGQWYMIGNSESQVWNEKKATPFPGPWSELNLSDARNRMLWEVRHLFLEPWTVDFWIHGIVREKFPVKLNDIIGVVLAIGASLIYNSFKSTFLSNVMGYAFSYVVIVMMSPTTFTTGSLVLFGLFFYDIYMVFYTPYMVTVATKLDVPIKLVFEGPTRSSMLGLGDIVLPGIFVALCLRFDHYMYYYRRQKLVPVELKTEEEASSGQVVATTRETQRMVVKPDYINPQGQWGDRFWSANGLLGGVSLLSSTSETAATPALRASAFPKTYFRAAMAGYLVAMLVTLAMLLVFNHAQPALLYLVPGVVAGAWLTGAARRELREMWAYTEDGSLDKEDVIVEVDENGKVVRRIEAKDGDGDAAKTEDRTNGKAKNVDKEMDAEKSKAEKKTTKDGKASRAVVHFSIYPPSPLSE